MYRTILSAASHKAVSAGIAKPGLTSPLLLAPVLCCPLVPAVEVAVEAGLSVATELASDNGGEGQGQCPGSSLDFTAAVTYIPPGRLTANHTPVSDNASVDELIATVRGDLARV